MWRTSARRLVAIALCAVIAMAIAVPPGHVSKGGKATAAMTMDISAMPVHGNCDGCAGRDKSTVLSLCSVLCSATAALPFVTVAYNPLTAHTLGPRDALTATGIAVPPDPYPPRPGRMS